MSSSLPRNPRMPVPEGETGVNIFGYTPSLAHGVIALVIFLLWGVFAQTFHAVRAKGVKGGRAFAVLFVLGSAMDEWLWCVGYGMRIAASRNPFVLVYFIVQYFMIVVAPVFYTAGIYLVLASVVRASPAFASASLLRPRALLAIFIVADVLTTALQVAGAALIGVAESQRADGKVPPLTPEQANRILLAGLCVQSFSFLIYLILLFVFLARVYSRSGPRPDSLLMGTLLLTSLLIFLRTLFRLAESAPGPTSGISSSQALFALLESLPVMLAIVAWASVPVHARLTRQRQRLEGQEKMGEMSH